jgi:hypothetical protein
MNSFSRVMAILDYSDMQCEVIDAETTKTVVTLNNDKIKGIMVFNDCGELIDDIPDGCYNYWADKQQDLVKEHRTALKHLTGKEWFTASE